MEREWRRGSGGEGVEEREWRRGSGGRDDNWFCLCVHAYNAFSLF